MSQFASPQPPADLLQMLTYARPHRSPAESAFVQEYLMPLPGMNFDKFGNGWVRIGTAPVLWSSHTDTVHHKDGRQTVLITGGYAHLPKSAKRGVCLGADDAAGVWLMREMILSGTSGLYIFHAGEEHGGLGSAYIAEHGRDMLAGIDYAIALDRKGLGDVITHQIGGRCCSDAFAQSLAGEINLLSPSDALRYKPDQTGTFTDTANYTDLIGECTNLSVGYENAHSHNEELDLVHLMELREALCGFDVSGLVLARQPGEIDPNDYLDLTPYVYSQGEPVPANSNTKGKGKGRKAPKGRVREAVEFDEALIELCRDYPEIAAKMIEELGCNAEDFLNTAWCEGYDIPHTDRPIPIDVQAKWDAGSA